MSVKSTTIKLVAAGVAVAFAAGFAPASADDVLVGLITKTDNNPFFVKMREGAAGQGQRAWRQVSGLCRQV